MANPIYDTLGATHNPFASIIEQARNFRQTFKGNPKDEVQRLLNSGQMSQAQFNELSAVANQIIRATGGKF